MPAFRRTARVSAVGILFALLGFLAVPSPTVGAQGSVDLPDTIESEGLVIKCGFPGTGSDSEEEGCTFEHIKQLGFRVMKYLIWFATFGIFLLIAYTGTLFATNVLRGGDAESEFRDARKKLVVALGGLTLVLGAWLAVEFFFVDLFQVNEDIRKQIL